jgi:hypothetical protein
MIASVVMLMIGCGLFNETMPGPGVGPNTSVGGLHIDATLGIYLAEYPRATDGPVSGLGIKITEKDPTTGAMLDVSKTAVLKVNGVTVPYVSDGFSTDFRLEKVVIPNAEPGSTLTISATHGAGSATFQIPCPDTILTAPTENVKVTDGQDLAVSWTGKLRYASIFIFAPRLSLKDYAPAINSIGNEVAKGIFATDSNGTVKIPTGDGKTSYVAELSVPGDSIKGDGGEGTCFVVRRRHLIK